jgi:poly(A) polymerase
MQTKPIDASQLGIDLTSKTEQELFKWLLASLLFGKPIQQLVARQAYEQLIAAGIISLDKLFNTTWDELVALLDQAHYVRYDFSTATKLLEVGRSLQQQYGSVSGLLNMSADAHDLEQRLEAFKGIGPVTAGIFMRDVVPIWFPEPVSHDYDSARQAAEILDKAGFEAYFIGGAVRDLLIGHQPKDFDLVTNATPAEITAIPEFQQSFYQDTAQAFGVTRVRLGTGTPHEVKLEIATFRRDIAAHLGRKATTVEFAELEEDVLRRDFTINALALNPLTGQLIDYVGGMDDLDHKLIRFIGKPIERTREDPLRLVRAIRLKNQLGFSYEPQTKTAIRRSVRQGDLQSIAVDRLRDELTRMFIDVSRRRALIDLDNLGILKKILAELAAEKEVAQPPEYHAEGNVWRHELLVMDYLPHHPSKQLAWAALLHDIGKGPTLTWPKDASDRIRFNKHYAVGAEMARSILRRLKFSNHDISDICWIIYNHIAIDDIPLMRPSRRHKFFGHPAFADLLELHYVDARASWRTGRPRTQPQFENLERLWHEYQAMPAHERHPSLKQDLGIDGHWLLKEFAREAQIQEGPLIGDILRYLEEWYLDTGVKDPRAYKRKARQLIELKAGGPTGS